MASNEPERELKRLGKRRIKLRRDLAQNSADITNVVREAHSAGIAKTEIARLAQISRVTLDQMLND